VGAPAARVGRWCRYFPAFAPGLNPGAATGRMPRIARGRLAPARRCADRRGQPGMEV